MGKVLARELGYDGRGWTGSLGSGGERGRSFRMSGRRRSVLSDPSIGNHRSGYEPAGIDVDDKKHLSQEDHSHR
jgi:hypothetical protein